MQSKKSNPLDPLEIKKIKCVACGVRKMCFKMEGTIGKYPNKNWIVVVFCDVINAINVINVIKNNEEEEQEEQERLISFYQEEKQCYETIVNAGRSKNINMDEFVALPVCFHEEIVASDINVLFETMKNEMEIYNEQMLQAGNEEFMMKTSTSSLLTADTMKCMFFTYEGLDLTMVVPTHHTEGFTIPVEQVLLNVVHKVDRMHRYHILHQDIKPENILLLCEPAFDIKFIDVGTLSLFQDAPLLMMPSFWKTCTDIFPTNLFSLQSYWMKTQCVGTLLYTPPERLYPKMVLETVLQHKNNKKNKYEFSYAEIMDAVLAIDRWSLGITILQILFYEEFQKWRNNVEEKGVSFFMYLWIVDLVQQEGFGKSPSFPLKNANAWVNCVRSCLQINPFHRRLFTSSFIHKMG